MCDRPPVAWRTVFIEEQLRRPHPFRGHDEI